MGAQKNRLMETVLLNTHNICFGWETTESFFIYTLLSTCTVELFNYIYVSAHEILVLIISIRRAVRFDSLRPSQQSFSYVGTGLPGLNQ